MRSTILTLTFFLVFFNSFPQSYPQRAGSGTALSFNGTSQSAQIPDADNLNDFTTNDDFTLECWLKSDPGQAYFVNTDNDIIEKWTGNESTYPYVLRYNRITGQVSGAQYDGNVGAGVNSTASIGDNKWHHVAFIRSGGVNGTFYLYIDGILQGSSPDVATASTQNTSPLFIAKRGIPYSQPSSNTNWWKGEMDELRIWNIGLTQTQLRDRMCKKIDASDALYGNLTAYYRFDEGMGSSLIDLKNGVNGSMENNPLWTNSGAVLGNAANYQYVTTGLPASSISFPMQDDFSVTLTSGSYTGEAGVFVYRVDEKPNTSSGAAGVGANDRYFGVFTVNLSSHQYTAVYNYTGNPYVNNNNEATLALYKRFDNNASVWANASASLNTTANTLTATGQSTEYILGNTATILPVSFLSFQATKANSGVLVQWQTASEQNTLYFEVLRSNDGVNYTSIGTVNAAGHSSITRSYSFMDINPFNGNNFYKIKQVDTDSRYSFSTIQKLVFSKSTVKAWLGGNTIVIQAPAVGTILLYDELGRCLYHARLRFGITHINLSNKPGALYVLKCIQENGFPETIKLAKP